MQTVSQLLDRKGRQVWTIDPDATVLDAIGEMADKDVGALVVVEGARVLGLISERQYARGVALAGRSSARHPGARHYAHRRATGDAKHRCRHLHALITEHRTPHLPVMQRRGTGRAGLDRRSGRRHHRGAAIHHRALGKLHRHRLTRRLVAGSRRLGMHFAVEIRARFL
jgi:hypothetical protein